MILRYAYLALKKRQLAALNRAAHRGREIQRDVLLAKVARNSDSDFGRAHGFGQIRSVADFQKQVPVTNYEYFRPYIDRVKSGEVSALFGPGTKILMFTMTSGTTGEPKYLPVTQEFFNDYRRGWVLWGTSAFIDHRELVRLKVMQLSSDWQQYQSPSGIPCGNISGLAAETRPLVGRIPFCFPTSLARIHDAAAKHYTTLRVGLTKRRVGMLITANPSTLLEFARRADDEKESLVRDIRDGTLSPDVPVPDQIRASLRGWLRPRPRRGRQLETIISQTGRLGLRDAWPKLAVIGVWTGGAVGVYLPRLTEYFGETAIRDHGLSASEGRMTLPMVDGTSAGIVDYQHQFFEFIPEEEHDSQEPTVLAAHELEEGRNYFILLTTSGGLYRYDIHDVVRCVGFQGEMPLLEFLNKSKNFSNITGEKLSEHQAIKAVTSSFQQLGLPIATFTLAPTMEDRPRYLLLVEATDTQGRGEELARHVDAQLAQLNVEYAEKTASGRILPLTVRNLPPGTWQQLRRERTGQRGNFEEYKHPCLTSDLTFASRLCSAGETSVPGTQTSPPPDESARSRQAG